MVLSLPSAAIKIQAAYRGHLTRKKVILKAREKYLNILRELDDDDAIARLWWPYAGPCAPYVRSDADIAHTQADFAEDAGNAHAQVDFVVADIAHAQNAGDAIDVRDKQGDTNQANVDLNEEIGQPAISPLPALSPSLSLSSPLPSKDSSSPKKQPQFSISSSPLVSTSPQRSARSSRSHSLSNSLSLSSSIHSLPPVPKTPPKIPPSTLDKPNLQHEMDSEETLRAIKEARRAHLEEELMWAKQAIKNRKQHLRLMKRLQQLE